jgi:SAM-dependent methyltransferase
MPSVFNARDAGNYEKLMGRWSRRLAPLFIEHAGIADGEHVLEIGCGTGSLTFALPEVAALAGLTAIDHSEIYLAAARAKNRDPRTPSQRMLWDIAATLDEAAAEARDRTMSRPIYAPGALPKVSEEAGLVEIDMRSLMIRMDFASFADYWEPYASGEGALGAYVATLDRAGRERLERHLCSAYLTGRPDGERSFVAVALSCRGAVPKG